MLRLALVFSLLFVWGEAQAQFSVSAASGLNVCTPDEGADCQSIQPAGFLAAGLEYRFFTYVGLGLDYDYGWLNPEANGVGATTSHFMPMLRVHYPIPNKALEIHLGAGMGYADVTAEHDDDPDAFYNFSNPWTSVKTTLGVLYSLNEDLAVGGKFDLYFHRGGERCLTHPIGQANCKSMDDLADSDQAVADLSQIGAVLRYTF